MSWGHVYEICMLQLNTFWNLTLYLSSLDVSIFYLTLHYPVGGGWWKIGEEKFWLFNNIKNIDRGDFLRVLSKNNLVVQGKRHSSRCAYGPRGGHVVLDSSRTVDAGAILVCMGRHHRRLVAITRDGFDRPRPERWRRGRGVDAMISSGDGSSARSRSRRLQHSI